MKHNYYRVEIPSDFSEDPAERGRQAIVEARDRARLYCMPCNWTVVKDDGHIVTVRRDHN